MDADRTSAFLKAQKKIIRQHKEDKAYFEWLKLPYWQRYDMDKINGLDDGECPGWYYKEHPEEFDLTKEGEEL